MPGPSTTPGSSTLVPGGETSGSTLQPDGISKPSTGDSKKPQTSTEPVSVIQPTVLPEPQLPPSIPESTPQPSVPGILPPETQLPVVLDPKIITPAAPVVAPTVNPDVPLPEIAPAPVNPTIPAIPAQDPPQHESLYMLTVSGHDNQVRDPVSGLTICSVPTDHVVYTKIDGESHDFMVNFGPMLFEAVLDSSAAGDQVLQLASNDKMRGDFSFTWNPVAKAGAATEDSPSWLQDFAVTVQSQADKSFEISNLKIQVAKDASATALVFSTNADALNQQFEVGYACPSSAVDTSVSSVASVSQFTSLSGICRYPGHLVFGLENSTADGGFQNLGDLCALANLSPKTWLKSILKLTKINFEGLAGTPARNGIWYNPDQGSKCSIRLEASVDPIEGIVQKLDKYIAGWKNDLPCISAIVTRTVVPTSGPWGDAFAEGQLVIAMESKLVEGVPSGLGAYVSFDGDDIDLMLVCYSSKFQWSSLKNWLLTSCTEVQNAVTKLEDVLGSVGKNSTTSSDSGKQGQAESLDHILWRKVMVTLRPDTTTDSMTLVSLVLVLEANFQILVPEGKSAVFTMTFSWDKSTGTFSGECKFDGVGPLLDAGEPPLLYHRDYERWKTLSYLAPSEPYMSLRQLSGGISEHLPFGIPTEISFADLSISNKQISFHGELQAILGQPAIASLSDSSPEINHTFLDVRTTVDFEKSPAKIDASVAGTLNLLPYRQGNPDAIFEASIGYGSEDSRLDFEASAANVSMSVLHTLFDEGVEREHAMSILEHITLREIKLNVNHLQSTGTKIDFDGVIEISGILLKTHFNRSAAKDWNFTAKFEKANAGSSPEDIDLGEAITKLLGPSVAEVIPEFVTKTKLKRKDPGNDNFEVVCLRIDDPGYLAFGAELKFGMLHVQFAQIAPIADESSPEAKQPVKKLIRVSVGPLPSVPKLPVIGELDVPFDALEFLWVSATVPKNEIDILNERVTMFKARGIALGEEETELAKGLHFRLASSGSVFLDHVFSDNKKPSVTKEDPALAGKESTEATSGTSEPPVESSDTPEEATSADSDGSAATTTATIDKKKGPLTLSGVALSYTDGKLRIHLDASVLVGPIEAGVQGLHLIMDVSKVDGLHNLLHIPMDIQIEGLDMSFNRSPVALAGALQHDPVNKEYAGGIAISLSKLSIAAFGMYRQVDAVASPPTPAYDSFFVYAMVEGLIFTVGWAEIRGLIAAFGYNSRLRLPTVDQITSFPLMQGFNNPEGFSMDKAIKSLTGPDAYMTPSRGSLWMALGLIIRACEVIDMQAVATVALGPNQTEIGLIARATATLPRGSSAESALMLIDLSVFGKLDLTHGELSVDGLINPTSFILNKDCRPSGGFSIRSWFGNSTYNGDWVVSFGGYHPLYKVPSHYPTPPRLGISWNLGENLRVTGNAYAAVTPGALMAGGLLQAVFSAGSFGAHFDAHADFLVNLKPLYYSADMAVFAGVYYEIRVWIVRKKISVNLGASLHLEGPPIHGQVHFDLCVVSFNVSFGSGRGQGARAIGLGELMDLVLQNPAKDRSGNVVHNVHTFTAISGLVADDAKKEAPQNDTAKKEPWVVRSDNFLFQVRSAVPASEAKVNGVPTYSGNTIISRPMHMKNDHDKITSTLKVMVCHADSRQMVPFKSVADIKDKLPANYWGHYSDNPGDYMRPDPNMPSLIDHLVGMTLIPPTSQKSENSTPVVKSVVESIKPNPWLPGSVSKMTTRFVDDDFARESVKWNRVKGAMATMPKMKLVETDEEFMKEQMKEKKEEKVEEKVEEHVEIQEKQTSAKGKRTKLSRQDIMKSFLAVAHPGTDAQAKKVHDAYKRIGSSVPRVVLNDPARFYISPPTVFCN